MADLMGLHPSLQIALVLHEAIRRLGIPPEDLYVVINRQGMLMQARQGAARCYLLTGNVPPGFTDAMWTAATQAWNQEATDEERADLYTRGLAQFSPVLLIKCLRDAGIVLPETIGPHSFENAPQA